MRLSRVKFTEIKNKRDYFELLRNNFLNASDSLISVQNKIANQDYVSDEFKELGLSLDDLLVIEQSLGNDIARVAKDREKILSEVSLLVAEAKQELKKYKNEATMISYKSNKTETKEIHIKKELLGRIVKNIKYNLTNTRLEFIVEFTDGSLISKYTNIDNVIVILKSC